MAKAYEITLKNRKELPRTLTVPRLAVTFVRGKKMTSPSPEQVRYAQRRPNMFHVKLLKAQSKDTAVASPPETQVEPGPESKPQDPVEEWMDLCAKASGDTPTVVKIEAFAGRHSIDLSEVSLKGDMVALVEEWLEE